MVLHMAAMFKEVSLTSDEIQFVMEKVLRMMNNIDLQELPPLVYQLLVLSTKVLIGYNTICCNQLHV